MQRIDIIGIKKLYKSFYRIRKVEEEIARIYPSDKIKSPVHLSIGQEAVSLGVCFNLVKEDAVFGSYRCHALYLAKGGSLKKMIAELYGKETGCAKGKGGSMHLIDPDFGVMGASAIVGTTIPVSVGYAYGLKYKKSNSIVVSFFGDGAVDEGVFHESINFAVLKKLPVLFICENNLYAIHSHHLSRHPKDNIVERAKSYGMEAERIEDGNIFNIIETSKKYIDHLRNHRGPTFLEIITCRWKEHVGPNDDFHMGYRDPDEVNHWKEQDELERLKKLLKPDITKKIGQEVDQEILDAFEFAENSSFPNPEDLYSDVFKE